MSQAGIVNDSISVNPTIPTSFVTDIGTAIPSSNVLQVRGGVGITTSASGNVVTITSNNSGIIWQAITSLMNTTQIVANNGYITKGSSTCILILPASSLLGDTFIVTGNTSLFQIMQNAGQQIFFGTQSTTAGVAGSLSSLQVEDHYQFLCIQANVGWKVITAIGNAGII